jgi:hypothetical protein
MVRFGAIITAFAMLALASAACAQTADPNQFLVLPGSATAGAIIVRMNTATGQASIAPQTVTFSPIIDTTPVGSSVYKLSYYSTFDAGATTREWDVYRFDTKSGRVWSLTCCTAPITWVEMVAAAK